MELTNLSICDIIVIERKELPMSNDWYRGKYPPTLLYAITTHSLLYTLGYSLETEVFVVMQPGSVIVLLQADGLEAMLRMGEPELEMAEMEARWHELISEWNTGGTISNEEKDRMFEASPASLNSAQIVAGLARAGFRRRPRSQGHRTLH